MVGITHIIYMIKVVYHAYKAFEEQYIFVQLQNDGISCLTYSSISSKHKL